LPSHSLVPHSEESFALERCAWSPDRKVQRVCNDQLRSCCYCTHKPDNSRKMQSIAAASMHTASPRFGTQPLPQMRSLPLTGLGGSLLPVMHHVGRSAVCSRRTVRCMNAQQRPSLKVNIGQIDSREH